MVRWPMVMLPGEHRSMNPDEQNTDPYRRPIVMQNQPADGESARRRPRRYFAWAGTGVIALAAATVLAGGTAVWSAIDSQPGNSPAPLSTSTPENVAPQAAFVSPSPDDHGDRRVGTPGSSTTPREPGDDKGGLRKPGTVEPSDDKGGLRNPGTVEPGDDKGGHDKGGDDKGGSGKSSDDPAGHH